MDHYLENVKRDAEEMSGEDSMSSDDTDFNPDALEALSAKEEYDSEPSSTSSDSDGEVKSQITISQFFRLVKFAKLQFHDFPAKFVRLQFHDFQENSLNYNYTIFQKIRQILFSRFF